MAEGVIVADAESVELALVVASAVVTAELELSVAEEELDVAAAVVLAAELLSALVEMTGASEVVTAAELELDES